MIMSARATTVPEPPETFANPFILCVERSCQRRVTNVSYPNVRNIPCGHIGSADVCPSWGPVDGCTCTDPHEPPRNPNRPEAA